MQGSNLDVYDADPSGWSEEGVIRGEACEQTSDDL